MSTNSIVVGVFKEREQAQSAIDFLRSAEFNDEQISIATQEVKGGMYHIREALEKIDVSEEEADYYSSEFEAGRSIVLVRHDGRRSEALGILYLNGTRSHKYLNVDRHVDHNSIGTTASASTYQAGASQRFASIEGSKNSSRRDTQVTEQDEMASLHKLLKDVGLDHLL